MTVTEFVAFLLTLAVPVTIGLLCLFILSSPNKDKLGDPCRGCGERLMRPSGYIAHGFMRHMFCPMCNWGTYVEDPELKRQKREQLKGQQP